METLDLKQLQMDILEAERTVKYGKALLRMHMQNEQLQEQLKTVLAERQGVTDAA